MILTLVLRKYFYLPIIWKSSIEKDNVKPKKSYTASVKEKKELKKKLKEENNNWPELDIKIGKEIK